MPRKTYSFQSSPERLREYQQIAIKRGLENKTINKDDADLINQFIESSSAGKQGEQFIYKTINSLVRWRKYIGPYRKNKNIDIERAVGKFKRESGYSQNYQRDCIAFLKKFYKYLNRESIVEIDIERLREEVKMPKGVLTNKTREMLLTEDEVVKMIKACNNSMERAMFASLYYGGFRPIEIGTLTWEQVNIRPGKKTVVYNVRKKTGRPRSVPSIDALPYMAQWKQDYPGDSSGKNPVFIGRWKNQMTYEAFRMRIIRIADRAGIKKKVTAHLPRHSRITELRRKGVSDGSLMQMFWGGESNMLATYSHLTDSDAEDELLRIEGMKDPSPLEEENRSHICPECGVINGPTHDCCYKCGEPLTDKAKRSKKSLEETIAKLLLENPEILERALK